MKADPFVQLRLLDLQALDTALDQLAHRRRTLPELAEIERLDGLVDGLRDGIVLAETELSDLQREQDRFEREIDQVRTRKARDEERLGSGAITNPKQLQDMQHEVATLTRRQSDLEDGELEVMEKLEAVQARLDELTGRRDEHLAARAAAEQRRDASFAEIDAEVQRTTQERAELATTFPADLLALYEKVRAKTGGVGAAAIGQGRCGGCRLDLMNNEKSDVRAAAVDDVLRHEECGRIMVRTAESGL
ncbi:MAG TPA: C4-type zinc ribbon domain-containing protein [Mycobacteriales bacterium]|nr:C4-type zinc ribbon domain-containing protein [Mycobacteriales bacterium]